MDSANYTAVSDGSKIHAGSGIDS